jgi:uncharacterized protein (TIGR00369 family)
MSDDAQRTRTFSWVDPRMSSNAAKQTDGRHFLERVMRGEIHRPPIADLFDLVITDVEAGTVTFQMVAKEYMYNPIGSLHGGAISTLLDSVIGCAVHSSLPAGRGYTSLDLHVRFLRAITVDSGLLTAVGRVISAGRKTATGEGTLHDASGKLCATATSSCLLFDVE